MKMPKRAIPTLALALALTLALVLGSGEPVWAQVALNNNDFSKTLTTTPVQIAGNYQYRKSFYIENPITNSANIGYCVSTNNQGCTPSIGAAGTSVLSPGSSDYWPPGAVPQNPIWAVAATGSVPIVARDTH
jgi:hypothetical protein